MKRIFAAAAVAAMLATSLCGCTQDDPDTSPSATIRPSNTPVVTSNVTTSPEGTSPVSPIPDITISPFATPDVTHNS